ncbi:hypothetical protein ACSS7Z_04255 [Microbacterium sp. A82]|uniref:hypothetical protein n=1 Tax=unclassified Microbacterium TaxID=2609290 RepID=UPI003F2B6D1C
MTTGPVTLVAVPPRAPHFGSALRGEVVLTGRRVAVWVSLGVWAACIVVFAYLASYLTTVGAEWYTAQQQEQILQTMLPRGTAYYPLASLPLYGAPQFAILGAVLGASDYARGTIRTIVSRFPRRASLLVARLVNVALIAALAAAVTLLTSVLSSVGVAVVADRGMEFPPVGDLIVALLMVWLTATAFIALGFAIGSLTRSVLAAVAIAVGWVLGVESLAIGLLAPVVPFLETVQGLLPVGATSSLAAGLVPDGQMVAGVTAVTTPGAAIAVLIGWTVIAGATSWILFARRDLG